MRPILLTALAGVLMLSGHSAADPARSPTELKALPSTETEQVAKSDLSALLQLQHGFDEPRMMLHLGGVQFATASYGSDYAGLCRHDSLVLKYVPRATRDAPLKPYGVETTAWFTDARVADEPAVERGYVAAPACQALDNQKDVHWFSAKDADQAAQAILVFRKAQAGLRAGTLKVQHCSEMQPAKSPTCEAEILALAPFTSVAACSAPEGQICLELWTGLDKRTTVVFRRGTPEPAPGNYAPVTPGDIQSIALDEYIIVS